MNFAFEDLLWGIFEFCLSQGHMTSIEAKPVLASKCDVIKVTLPWLQQKPNVHCKRSSRARFQVICFIRELVTAPKGQLIWGQFTPNPSSNICIRLHFFFVRETVNLWDGLRDETFCLFCFLCMTQIIVVQVWFSCWCFYCI